MRLLYFVHNLNDAAVARRVKSLRRTGIEVIVTGFWREAEPPAEIAGAEALPLGRTYDAALAHRAFSSLRFALFNGRLRKVADRADIFMARNLEMLNIAVSVARRSGFAPAMVYEVLDIHRMLIGNNRVARGLRLLERRLLRKVDLLITSSPAFLREYFEPLQFGLERPASAVIENKAVREHGDLERDAELAAGPPWRIVWLGVVRCRRSLEILSSLAMRRPDLVSVEIHGKPTREVHEDLERLLPKVPALVFGGPYGPRDLSKLYARAHFNWAVDYYEAGSNSEWLLPNRLYEGGLYNAVPIALTGTETSRWLGAKGLGISLTDPAQELESRLACMSSGEHAILKRRCRNAPRSLFVEEQSDRDHLKAMLFAAYERRGNIVPGQSSGLPALKQTNVLMS